MERQGVAEVETKWFLISESSLAALKSVATRLYSEDRMSGDQMRNTAQKIDGVIAGCVVYATIEEWSGKGRKS